MAREHARRGGICRRRSSSARRTRARTARCGPQATPRSGSSTTSVSAEAFAAVEAAAAAGVELVMLHVAYARGGLPRFRQETVGAYLAEIEALRAARRARRPRSALRAGVPGGLAGGDRALRGARADFRCTCTPTSSRRRSRSASPSTGCDRSSSWRAPAVSARERPSSMRPMPTAPSSICSPRREPTICACPTTEADLGDGFLPAERIRVACDPALHRNGLERAHRSLRGASRARGDRAAANGPAGDLHDRGAAPLRLGARGSSARARRVARDRGRPHAPLARGSRCRSTSPARS